MSDTTTRSSLAIVASTNMRGIAIMLLARILFAISDTFTKLATESLPGTEVVTLRNLIALPVVFAMAAKLGALSHWTAVTDGRVMTRSILDGIGTIAFVIALPHVMIAQSTVILLTVPIILVALSALIYREEVGWRRWTAILTGFLGVFLVAGPVGGAPNTFLAVTQMAAIAWAFRDLFTSRIGKGIPSVMVSLIATVTVAVIGLPGAFAGDWRGVTATEALYLLGAGTFVATANFSYISALRTGAIAVVAPFRYTAALWAAVAGFLVWGDVPDAWGVLGTLLIVGSGLYTLYREMEAAKKRQAAKA